MRITKSLRRAIAVAFVGLLIMSGVLVTGVSAQEPPSVVTLNLNAPKGVCTGEIYVGMTATTAEIAAKDFDPLVLSITWDGTKWVGDGAYVVGSQSFLPNQQGARLILYLKSTGAPGDRVCSFNGANTAFVNANNVELLPANSALLVEYGNFGSPTSGAPFDTYFMGSKTIPVNTETSEQWGLWVEVTSLVNSTSPAGTYISTLTINVSNPNNP